MAIYFFHRLKENIVKIGFTDDIAQRQRTLANLDEWASGEVVIIRLFQGDRSAEGQLLKRFETQKADPPQAEWFEWRPGKDDWFKFSDAMLTEDFGLIELPIPPAPPRPKRLTTRSRRRRFAEQDDFSGIDQRLRLLRLAVAGDKTQAQFCEENGFSPQQWSNYERGHGLISIHSANRLRDAYGASIDWIYNGCTDDVPLWVLDLDPALTFGGLRQTYYPNIEPPNWLARWPLDQKIGYILDAALPRKIRVAMGYIKAREAGQIDGEDHF
jgi:transcriptional regulator with XRE-family HTH domain